MNQITPAGIILYLEVDAMAQLTPRICAKTKICVNSTISSLNAVYAENKILPQKIDALQALNKFW
jgi:hypothetical protein